MASQKHTHKYYKVNGLFYCGLSDCTHFMPKNVAPTILGKLSICWSCEKEFPLSVDSLSEDTPKCDECKTKMEVIAKILEEKGI